MNMAQVSAIQTDESTNDLYHYDLLAFKIQMSQASVKKCCLNKCLVGQWSITTYTS
jgi:hypothetical protein